MVFLLEHNEFAPGPEHISKTTKLAVVIGRTNQPHNRNSGGESEHPSMVTASDDNAAALDLCDQIGRMPRTIAGWLRIVAYGDKVAQRIKIGFRGSERHGERYQRCVESRRRFAHHDAQSLEHALVHAR